MKKEIAIQWVKALRSGKYRQERDALKRGESFCCLGVLCDITKDELGLEWTYDDRGDQIDGEGSVLPEQVKEYAGLRGHNPGIGVKSLAAMNDRGVEFDRIADLIEEHWEKL